MINRRSYLLHPGDLRVLPLVELEVLDLADVRAHGAVHGGAARAQEDAEVVARPLRGDQPAVSTLRVTLHDRAVNEPSRSFNSAPGRPLIGSYLY